jgi:hypothetical protein
LQKPREVILQELEAARKDALARSVDFDETRIIEGTFLEVRYNLEEAKRPDGTLSPVIEAVEELIKQSLQRRQKLASSRPQLMSGRDPINPN